MFQLLKCVAGAVVKNGAKFLLNLVPGAEALSEIAADAWENWRKKQDEAALRSEVQALAQASPQQVRAEVQAAVQAEAGGQPVEVQQALTAYLTQVPAMIRRSLRRPSDPSGTTVPSGCRLNKVDDLLAFLPPRPLRFKAGDRPLPGVDWELVELLGVGGFGEVWKAKNPHMASVRPVALKFCLDPKSAKVLRHEAAVLDRVMRDGRHPAIVQLQHTYLSADPLCLEYEYVDGGDLTGLMQDAQGSHGGMAPPQAAKVLLRLAEVIGYTHRLNPPIVHRDLKPANILVQRGADGKRMLRIADFGIGGVAAGQALQQSRHGTTRGQCLTTAVRGAHTPLYASPEQMRGEPPDPRDDVHALGVIWYQLLTGDLTAGAPSGLTWPNELRQRGMNERQIQLLASCLEGRAANRPADASAVAEVLAKDLQARAVPMGKLVGPPPPPASAVLPARPIPPRPVAVHPPQADADNPQVAEYRQGLFLGKLKALQTLGSQVAEPVSVVACILGGILIGAPAGLVLGVVVNRVLGLHGDSGGTALACVIIVLVISACALLLWWIGIERKKGLRRSLEGMIREIAPEYSQEVNRWGGVAMLRDALAVQELVCVLEGKKA